MRPLCFVLMPFGTKPSGTGGSIDFDAVYREIIAPAVEAAGLDALRADEEQSGGIIHKPMFERLILCDFAIADLTTANANVFYELGLRHAVRRHSTLLMFADGGRLPFDVHSLRALPYRLTPDGRPADAAGAIDALTRRIAAARSDADTDSPLYQLVQDYPNIQREKTDVFRQAVDYCAAAKRRLAAARRQDVAAVRAEEAALGSLEAVDLGVLVDLLLSYRAVKAWTDMIALVERLPRPLRDTVMVQEQLGLALNRAGRGDDAETILKAVIAKHGPSSETYGILGRVFKDRWEAALTSGDTFAANGLLEQAIETYLKGFEADWRDAYPGVNAVTLMELKDEPDPRRTALIPVVKYAVDRRVAAGAPDYWDWVTLVELAVLAKHELDARAACGRALAMLRERWEAETTARNLRLIREARERRGEGVPWARTIEDQLAAKAR